MKYIIECKVDSNIFSKEKLFLNKNGVSILFLKNRNNIINKIKVEAVVKNSDKFNSSINHNPNGEVKFNFHISVDPIIREKMLMEIQKAESFLSIIGVNKIYWHEPKEYFKTETEDEKSQLFIKNIKGYLDYKKKYHRVNQETIKKILINSDQKELLIIPLAFFREGINEHEQFKYVNAFYNFYFVIEGLYGNGKTKNNAIEIEYNKSEELKKYIIEAMNSLNEKHKQVIKTMIASMNKSSEINIKNIIHMIVKTRGMLHHFSLKSTLQHGHPFVHFRYESISFLLLNICIRILLDKVL
jgi:hypothetical protein